MTAPHPLAALVEELERLRKLGREPQGIGLRAFHEYLEALGRNDETLLSAARSSLRLEEENRALREALRNGAYKTERLLGTLKFVDMRNVNERVFWELDVSIDQCGVFIEDTKQTLARGLPATEPAKGTAQ